MKNARAPGLFFNIAMYIHVYNTHHEFILLYKSYPCVISVCIFWRTFATFCWNFKVTTAILAHSNYNIHVFGTHAAREVSQLASTITSCCFVFHFIC